MGSRSLGWCDSVLLLTLACSTLGGCKAVSQASRKVVARAKAETQVTVGEAPNPGSLVAARWHFHAAVFSAAPAKRNARAAVTRLAGKRFSVLTEGTAVEKVPGALVVVALPEIKDYPPPELDQMQYRASVLNEEQQRSLHDCQAVTLLSFEGPGSQAAPRYRAALELIEALALEQQGFPWDEDARKAHTSASWKELLETWQAGEPNIGKHVTLDLYRDEELFRVVSLGMTKFALPDLAVNQVGSADGGAMVSLTQLALQTVWERGQLPVGGRLLVSIDALRHDGVRAQQLELLMSNAKKSVELEFAVAKRQDGDADNRLLELVFPGAVASLQERQSAALIRIYGAEESVAHLKHDQQLLEASARSRAKATAIGKRYAKGPPFGEELQVKAPFAAASGGREWMWVEVVSWQGDDISGILRNDPTDVPSLKNGARVHVEASNIFDYLLTKRDGSYEGNETGEIIMAREKQAEEARKK